MSLVAPRYRLETGFATYAQTGCEPVYTPKTGLFRPETGFACPLLAHSLNKTLTRAGFPTEFKEWTKLAQDRASWRARVYALAEYPTPPPVRASH